MKNESLQNELQDLLGDRFSKSTSVRSNYAGGEDVFDPILSEAVVFPKNNEEISSIVKLCNRNKTPIIPFGSGTSLEGNVVGNVNGITLSLEKMNKVINVNEHDFDCRVQAYVTRKQLNEELKSKGVFFPIDPGADASLGGMTSTSASGTMAVRYGTMRTVVSGLTVILANGDIIKTGTRSKKTAAGSGGEIQLTDAMKLLAQVENMYSWTFKGKRYDIGTMEDWFRSHIELSVKSEYSSVLKGVLKTL